MSPIPGRCPYCGSADYMKAFRRKPNILFLSLLVPRLRRLYCRSCARHFPALLPKRATG
jgi:hypothetical protein